jgi:hypothetical protein
MSPSAKFQLICDLVPKQNKEVGYEDIMAEKIITPYSLVKKYEHLGRTSWVREYRQQVVLKYCHF